MPLPLIVIGLLVAVGYVALLLGYSWLAISIPQLGAYSVGIVFLVFAWILPETSLKYQKEGVSFTAKGAFAVLGVGIILVTLLGTSLASFFSGFYFAAFSGIAPASFTSEITNILNTFGITPALFGQVLVVVMGSLLTVVIVDRRFRKRALKRLPK